LRSARRPKAGNCAPPPASLARLLRKRRRTAEARDLMAPVYNWFTEGFDTAELKDAKATGPRLVSGGVMGLTRK
jgi:hypothetical protein